VKIPAAISFITLGILFGAACSSTLRQPALDVSATVNPLAPVHEVKSYEISCSDELVRQWFLSNPAALAELGAALEAQGYDEALDPDTATHSIRVALGFGPRAPLRRMENPDSIRHLNVAGMVGGGRYTQVLTERQNHAGSLLLGPGGEIIATGELKRMEDDAKRHLEDTHQRGTHDSLILRAWDVTDPDRENPVLAWEITVRRRADHRMPSPEHVGILIRGAAEKIEAGFAPSDAGGPTGPTEEKQPAGASVE
jgi:hypothetical protein